MKAPAIPPKDVLAAIGNTPLVELRRVVPLGAGRVVLKLESANPTGSMKDRVARAMVTAAANDGRLPPGGTVIEYTGGTTGVSVAFICAAMGYKAHFVYSDAFSNEKRVTMRSYGAGITDVQSEGGKITATLIKAMIAKATAMSEQPGHWFCNQLENRDGEAGYHALGDEMWQQAGRVDAFVQSVGSAHSIHGTATALRRHNPELHVTAVEPAESSVLQGEPPGAHKIEGIGIGFRPPLWRPDEVNAVAGVSTDDANAMARRLAREEAIFAGTSTGANVIVAIEVAKRLGPGATVGAIVVDSGLRYISTDAYAQRS
jgi:cysteine synthase A